MAVLASELLLLMMAPLPFLCGNPQGRNLGINSSLAIFITMNPMYEFRNVLPSNLKVTF